MQYGVHILNFLICVDLFLIAYITFWLYSVHLRLNK